MATVLAASQDTGVLPALPGSEEKERLQLLRHLQQNRYIRVKMALEFCAAAVLLVLTSPLVLLCALLVKLTSRGPAFYSQTRVGLRGRPYLIYKLRTMYHQCELHSGPQWSQKGDPRVTPLGRFLRRTHLDELPQLWNVLKGEMGLVGPRPERPEFIPALARAIPLYEARVLVRPGVTGLAQVQLPADSDLESVRAKLAHDLYYVRNVSPWMDLRILGATFFKVFGAPFGLLHKGFQMPALLAVEGYYEELQKSVVPAQAEVRPGLLSAR
jgi:lipopolysaccharide/colanic/teichoic acid biosynthesis glycosyltransferase